MITRSAAAIHTRDAFRLRSHRVRSHCVRSVPLALAPFAVPADAAFARNWISKASLGGASAVELYGVALYIALSCIFAGGSGTVPPASPTEYYFQSAMVILGSSVWAYVLSSGCGIIATLNPNGVHYRHMMDELNYFAREKRCAPAGEQTRALRLSPPCP